MNEADHATLINLAACLARSVEREPAPSSVREWAAMLRMMSDFIEHADVPRRSLPAVPMAGAGCMTQGM